MWFNQRSYNILVYTFYFIHRTFFDSQWTIILQINYNILLLVDIKYILSIYNSIQYNIVCSLLKIIIHSLHNILAVSEIWMSLFIIKCLWINQWLFFFFYSFTSFPTYLGSTILVLYFHLNWLSSYFSLAFYLYDLHSIY